MCHYQFVETIKIFKKKIYNLNYHQLRLLDTFQRFYPGYQPHDLLKIFSNIKIPSNKLLKARFLYNQSDFKLEISPYKHKIIKCLKIVYADYINYEYKFLDRQIFTKLLNNLTYCNEILIVKKGYITDTSFSNIVFFDGKDWFTPTTYLLPGTFRQFLLDSGKIKETKITINDLKKYSYFKLINSLLSWDLQPLPIQKILL